MLLVLITASALVAPAAEAKKKPDLVVSKALKPGPPYAFADDQATRLAFRATTENIGNASAGPSHTRLVFVHENAIQARLSRAIGKLRPGGADDSSASRTAPLNLLLGRYKVAVCADDKDQIKESDESNNCRSLGRFYVANRNWAGSLSMFTPFYTGSDAGERATSSNARFEFSDYLGTGVFSYEFNGDVTWSDSGADEEGCTHTGGATRTFGQGADTAAGELLVDHQRELYYGDTAAAAAFYPIDYVCEGDAGTRGGPYEPTFFAVKPGGEPLPWGGDALKGSSAANGVTSFVWDLR